MLAAFASVLIRLVTYADYVPSDLVSVRLRHVAQLGDGREIVLLDDRGWDESGSWTDTSVADVEAAARRCVGPDEPTGARTHDDVEAQHYAQLAAALRVVGVPASGPQVRALPHAVLLSPALRAKAR